MPLDRLGQVGDSLIIGHVRCPKCGADVTPSELECAHCGIVWEYLLNAMGASHRDHDIALVVQRIGATIMILALVWAAIGVWNQVSRSRGSRAR